MKYLRHIISLEGKVAIVTGGAKGIGYAICYRLAEAGAKVLVADIDGDAAAYAAERLQAEGFEAWSLQTDVSQEADIDWMMESAAEHGGVDVLVNNAGIYPPVKLSDMTTAMFERVLNVNLKSVYLATRRAAEVMRHKKAGVIINITSIDAIHPSMAGLSHYDASKHAVWGFTKNTALELAPYGIRVNAVAPGGILTPGVEALQATAGVKKDSKDFAATVPMERLGDPDEIGKVCLFLASEMSSYMTGSQVVVDGGALVS